MEIEKSKDSVVNRRNRPTESIDTIDLGGKIERLLNDIAPEIYPLEYSPQLDSTEYLKDATEISETDILISEKVEEIERVLNSFPIDADKLKCLAIEDGGFIKDDLRKKAWPILMQLEDLECYPLLSSNEVKSHKDYNQVVLDVNRSLKRFPPGIDEEYRLILMEQLTELIIQVLQKHPHLHYYQGYHDVAITFLLVTGKTMGFHLMEKLSITHLSEFMKPTMERTVYYLTYVYPILKRANYKIYEYLNRCNVGTMFCLPWLITWYAHALPEYRDVVRLYDFFLATPYLMPMYLAAAIVLHQEEAILKEECDMALQHFLLSKVPDSLPFEDMLQKASDLHSQYPPDTLQEEVQHIIHQRKLDEEEERRRRFTIQVKGDSLLKVFFGIFFGEKYVSSWARGIVRVVGFAFIATLTTGFYGYYTNSPYLEKYFPSWWHR